MFSLHTIRFCIQLRFRHRYKYSSHIFYFYKYGKSYAKIVMGTWRKGIDVWRNMECKVLFALWLMYWATIPNTSPQWEEDFIKLLDSSKEYEKGKVVFILYYISRAPYRWRLVFPVKNTDEHTLTVKKTYLVTCFSQSKCVPIKCFANLLASVFLFHIYPFTQRNLIS